MTGTKIDTIKIRQLNREQTFEYNQKESDGSKSRCGERAELKFSDRDQYRYRVGRSRTDLG